jgi:stearoyl-CoA 9-desaturase NADPH oxidoreductase
VTRTRTYSVSSSAHRDDGRFTVTVKRKDGGLVSGHLHDAGPVGAVLACSAATGEVVLPDRRPERLLLISAGSGITPVASMLRTLADEGHTGAVTFLHYARSRADVPFLADLEAIAAGCRAPALHVVTTGEASGGTDGPRSPDAVSVASRPRTSSASPPSTARPSPSPAARPG